MSRRLALTVVLLVWLLAPALAAAQTAPLAATLSFGGTSPPFSPTTPIAINLLLTNVSGGQVLTIAGFSQTEFWRNLYFDLPGVGTITDANASTAHSLVQFGTCHYRKNQVLPGSGIQVLPVEVLPLGFAVQFDFGDVRAHFDLSRPGQYTVNARITFTAYDSGAVINDCNIEFGNQSLLSIGDQATVGRQEFSIVSNSLTFTVSPSDTTPPVVTPPASITVAATESGGARGSVSLPLAAFLAGGSATDDLDPAPVRLPPQVGGFDVTDDSLFPIGTTAVTFRYQDRTGNVGTVTSNVTVTATTGTPAISVSIAGSGIRQAQGRVLYYDLRFTNTGTATAQGVTLQQMTFKTLSGTGNAAYNTQHSPPLPVALGNVAAGASTTLRIYVTVPPSVKRFSMTESGQFKNAAGSTLTYSSTQTVTP